MFNCFLLLHLLGFPVIALQTKACIHLPSSLDFCVGGHGGNHVAVEGSFDNWAARQTLQRSGKNFTVVKLLPPGVYQVNINQAGISSCCSSVATAQGLMILVKARYCFHCLILRLLLLR